MNRLRLTLAIWIAVACITVSAVHANTIIAQAPEAQDQKKVWPVIEYPEGREVIVDLEPTPMMPDAKGTARVMRAGDETSIQVEMSGVTGDATSYNLYAVDDSGKIALLGTVPISEGAGTLNVKTSLPKFMLVLSPEANLTAIADDTPIVLRSTVPSGLEVVSDAGSEADREQDDQASAGDVTYDVPMLGVSDLKRGADTTVRVDFASDIEGVRANASIKPQKGGTTQIKARFFNLKQASGDIHYILWVVSPDQTYTRLGRFVPKSKNNEARIEAKTALPDFGLFVTTEEADAPASPTGSLVAKFIR